MTNGNHQAFGYGFDKKERNPRYGRGSSEEFLQETVEYKGLTKREYFAARLMQGMLSNPYYNQIPYNIIAQDSVSAADVLIKALNDTI